MQLPVFEIAAKLRAAVTAGDRSRVLLKAPTGSGIHIVATPSGAKIGSRFRPEKESFDQDFGMLTKMYPQL